jgi:hypothetical protein
MVPPQCRAADRFESLAYFTSIGPTTDNRIKPDIIAPGTTISATLCAGGMPILFATHPC